MKHNLTAIVAVLVVGVVVYITGLWFQTKHQVLDTNINNPTTTTIPATSTPTLSPEVTMPTPNSVVGTPLEVQGQLPGSWFFEATARVEVLDSNLQTLATGYVQAEGDWMTTSLVPFYGVLSFTPPTTSAGFVILKNDNPSGLSENQLRYEIPVQFATGTAKVKIYLANTEDEATNLDCLADQAYEVTISKTQGVAKAAILSLLAYNMQNNADQKYTSPIPGGTKLLSVIIDNGIAKANFSKQLDEGVAGSCRVGMIRSAIENTLKQFTSAESVQIYVEGNSEEVLQP